MMTPLVKKLHNCPAVWQQEVQVDVLERNGSVKGRTVVEDGAYFPVPLAQLLVPLQQPFCKNFSHHEILSVGRITHSEVPFKLINKKGISRG